MAAKILVNNKKHLERLISDEISLNGNQCDLNHLDVSKVTNMSYIFYDSPFNGDISNWDVSNVTNMGWMFMQSSFNGDISQWNVSKVTDMEFMFVSSKFNKDLTIWKPYKIGKNKKEMFSDCSAPKPYWAVAENVENAIQIHELHENLNIVLENKLTKQIKSKI